MRIKRETGNAFDDGYLVGSAQSVALLADQTLNCGIEQMRKLVPRVLRP
jgi:hypothetical protein